MIAKPYALQPGEGWKYSMGVDFLVKRGEVAPGSGAAFLEYETRRGEEPGIHTHPSEDEMFYVLQGKLRFRCGEAVFDLAAGGFIFLPCGVAHTYEFLDDHPVRLVVVTAPVRHEPGGWKGFVSEMEQGQPGLAAAPDPEGN